jgi:hypothetical protein
MTPRNPYTKRSAILSPADFYGRERELSEIYSRVMDGMSVSLVGERRIGKSSILSALRFEEMRRAFDVPDEVAFVHIDMQYISDCTEEVFLDYLLAQIAEELSIEVPPPRRHNLRTLARKLRSLNRRLVVVIDEFDVLVENQAIPPDLFAFLRALSSENELPYVIASREGSIDQLARDPAPGSAFLNIFSTVYVGPMPQDEAEELVTAPASNVGLPFNEREVQTIFRLAGRYPLFLQIACYLIFARKLAGDRDASASEEVLRSYRYETGPHFDYLMGRLSERARTTLVRWIGNEGGSADEVGMAELLRKGVLVDDSGRKRVFSTVFEERVRQGTATEAAGAGSALAQAFTKLRSR